MSVDPFRNVHPRATQVIWRLARHLHTITAGMSSWIGRGWDPGSSEHGTGRALDIIIADKVATMPTAAEKAVGNLIVAWLIRHADQLHIRHIIWDGRIWKRRYRGTPTEWTTHRGNSISSRHQDHVHVYLDDATGTVPDAPLIPAQLIQKEITEMDANELAAAVLAQPITANGKTDTLAQHLAELFVDTRAQSVAVATEARRDSAAQQQLVDKLGALANKLEEVLK